MGLRRLRWWILGTALGSFAAGMNVGLVAPKLFAAEDARTVADDESYVRDMAADYGLSGEQERSLRMVMQRLREEQMTAFRAADFEMLPPTIQGELRSARGRAEQRIRAILDEEQRARYDDATRPK